MNTNSTLLQFTTTNFTEQTVVLYWNLVALQYMEARGMTFLLIWLQEVYLNFTWTWDSYPRDTSEYGDVQAQSSRLFAMSLSNVSVRSLTLICIFLQIM